MPIQSKLGSVRTKQGLAAADLAARVGVSRQTIHAIEAGDYLPNTQVALLLARELHVGVEDLFSLPEPAEATLPVELLSPARQGAPLRLTKVNAKWIAAPASAAPYFLPEADGTLSGKSALLAAPAKSFENRLLLSGCDPATALLATMVRQSSGTELISAPASSKQALEWLAQDKVHIAGSHLEDTKTGDFNLPYLRATYPKHRFAVITFAHWEEGLVVAPNNPKQIRGVADLARKNVRLINREIGSGSRALLDRLCQAAGVQPKHYDNTALGHLAAAAIVAAAQADCCLATRSAARAYGLDFIPIHTERYDLIVKQSSLKLPTIQAFLNDLQRAPIRRKLEVLAGYDTSQTGAIR